DGVAGVLRLFAGGGFWRASNQVGGGAGQAALGLVIIALAALGARQLPEIWRTRGLAAAAVGFGIAIASSAPILRSGYERLTSLPIGAALRESERASVLMLVWIA